MIVAILPPERLVPLPLEAVLGVELRDGVAELEMGLVLFAMGFGTCTGCREAAEVATGVLVLVLVLEACALSGKVVGRATIAIPFSFGAEAERTGTGVG